MHLLNIPITPVKLNSVTKVRDRRLSAKLVPTFVDRGGNVVTVTDPSGRILAFLDRAMTPVVLIIENCLQQLGKHEEKL
jgi:hypothetical protein